MRRVLVVDDDTVVSKVLAVMLQRAGFEVDLDGDGVTGVEKREYQHTFEYFEVPHCPPSHEWYNSLQHS